MTMTAIEMYKAGIAPRDGRPENLKTLGMRFVEYHDDLFRGVFGWTQLAFIQPGDIDCTDMTLEQLEAHIASVSQVAA